MKKWILILLLPGTQLQAQTGNCVLKDPTVQINFGVSGRGETAESNGSFSYYRRVEHTCPSDGYYTITSYTADCFRGDWITLPQDHTEGDVMGNMLLVNASYRSGEFFSTMARGLKPGANYEFAVWMLNVCKPSEKCPFPLLPNITIRLESVTGSLVTQMNTGDLQRYGRAQWTKYSVLFTMPAGVTSVAISMVNHSPGGCGNDFALDDITFRECIPPPPPPITKKTVPNTDSKKATTTTAKTPVKKATPAPPKKEVVAAAPVAKKPVTGNNSNNPKTTTAPPKKKNPADSLAKQPTAVTTLKPTVIDSARPTPALTNRNNALVKRIETGEGEIRVDLYDNGEIDGDTVTIYHNNKLLVSRARLSQKAVTLVIAIDKNNPHHELVMVANNLGSIPPNTSLMVVTAGSKRYEVFISSNEQNNAKVVFDLRE